MLGYLDKGISVPEAAYASAANYVKSGSADAGFRHLGRVETWRGPAPRSEAVQEEIPWRLYLCEDADAAVSRTLLEFHLPEVEAPNGPSVTKKHHTNRRKNYQYWK